jgi:predicted membrane protein (TIGR00267 family)
LSDGFRAKMRKALSAPDIMPAMRRYFVNTVFDATFVMLGIVIGSAFTNESQMVVIVTTILTSAVALSISTGSSVFEAENMEQGRRIDRLGRAMLSDMEETDIGRVSRVGTSLVALFNSLAPLLVGVLMMTPFLIMGADHVQEAAEVAIGLAIATLFVTGFFMGRIGNKNPWVRGARMAVIGMAAFVICYLIGGAI